jgi:hypothetical protein
LSRRDGLTVTVPLAQLRDLLAPQGLNLIGAAEVARYDAIVPPRHAVGSRAPDARTLVVIGNGGGAFWEAFRCAREREALAGRQPATLDAFTRAVVMHAVASPGLDLGGPPRVAFPWEDEPLALSFVHLAECAGLGRRSLLGVLVHPEFGPWMALRAALLLPFPVDAPRPADGFDPCPSCVDRPCISACPAGAVGPGGWDVPRCAAHRLSATDGDGCDAGCHARIACVLAPEHRYPPEALAFHQASARAAMAARTR